MQCTGYIFVQCLLMLMVSCFKGNTLRNSQPRTSDPMTFPPTCDDVTPKDLEPDTPEGEVLVILSRYVFLGTAKWYNITNYIFNEESYDVSNSRGFNCNHNIFLDVRRFLCIRAKDKLEIRKGSGFRDIRRGSRIEVIIRPYGEDKQAVGICRFEFRISFHPTLTTLSTTTRPSTTATTTATTKKSSKAVPTTLKVTPTLLKTTSPNMHNSTTLSTKPVKKTTKSPDGHSSTRPTLEPCPGEKMLKRNLEWCMPITVEIPAILANASLQSSFEYKIDLPASKHILKTAFVKVGSYRHHLQTNSSFTVKVFYGTGSTKSLLKTVTATLGQEQTSVPVDKFIPTRNSRITVEIYRNGKKVRLPGELVLLMVDKYDFCLSNSCLDHYYFRKNYIGRHECTPIVERIPVAHFDTCFAVCPAEVTPSTNGSYLWPLTFPNSTVTLPCNSGIGNVSRVCHKVDNQIPKWKQVELKNCKFAEDKRSVALENLANVAIDASNASKASEKLKNITQSDPLTMPPSQLNSIAKILEELTTFATNEKVANDMLDTVDNCLEASRESLLEGQRSNNVSRRMVTILSTVCGAILANQTKFTMSKKGFAIAGSRESKSSFQGMVISYKSSVGLNLTNMITMDRGSNEVTEDSSSSIHLPRALLSSQGTDRNDLIFVAYDQGKLFQEKGPSRLNSKIISAEVRNAKISGLHEPVVTKFKTTNGTKGFEQICAWWDFSLYDGAGGWSSVGCILSEARAYGYAECHCNHLTNFAVLLGAKIPEEDTSHEFALKLISYIGIGISLAGTFFTLISYIIFPKLRDNAPPKILMNLCAALIFLQAIFLIGIERTSPRQGCQAVAFLLQYVLLCVLSWSGVEGFFSYRGIVMPMKSEVQNLMLKATMFGWVVPILFPILGIAFWPQEYGDERSCAVKGLPLYITVVAPVGLVMLLNLFSIISIMAALNKSSKMYPHNAFNAWHRLRIIAAFILLFGLTWFFGFLVIANDIVAFQYLFCIFNSLQGFFLFVFYGVRNENVRRSWLDKFQTYRERRAFSTSAGTKRTESSFDSATFNKSDSLRSNSFRKCKEIDKKDLQFQVHLQARANIYEAPPTV